MHPAIEYLVQLFILGPVLVALISIPTVAGFILLREGFWRLGLAVLRLSLIGAIVIVRAVRTLVA